MGSVESLPIWKRNATNVEWLEQLLQFARSRPEQFNRMVLVYESLPNKQGDRDIRRLEFGHEYAASVGWALETAKDVLMRELRG